MDVWAQLPKKAASAKRERVTDVPPLQFSTFAILADRIVATQQAILPPAGDNVSGTYVARKGVRAPMYQEELGYEPLPCHPLVSATTPLPNIAAPKLQGTP